MHVFYENLPPDDAAEIEQLSRLMYEIRSARDTRLAELGAADPEQALARSEPVEFAYAFSLDRAVSDAVRLGVAGFGELGTSRRLFPASEHYWGPVVKWRPGGAGNPLKLETGWLFPLGDARSHAKGQLRLNLEWEM